MFLKVMGALLVAPCAVVALPSEPAASAAAAPYELRVLDWNIKGATSDVPTIINAIKQVSPGPNIVTLQEIHECPTDNQVTRIATALGMRRQYVRSDKGGPDPKTCWAGNVILYRPEFKPLERGGWILPDSRIPGCTSGCPVKRSLAGLKLDVGGGKTVRVFTTHLSAGKSVENVRKQQMSYAIGKLTQASSPTVFTGDLNSTPGSPVITAPQGRGYSDTGARNNFPTTWSGARIDYVFANQGLRVVANTRPNSPNVPRGSDHRPVYTRLAVK